jgi:hypothetical protein
MGLKSKDVIPLCHPHHRTGGYGVAFHAGRKIWEKTFGTQRALLLLVHMKLGIIPYKAVED